MSEPTKDDLDDEDVYMLGHSYYKRCFVCGGEMQWCTCCEMWTMTCCEDYGSCMCS